MFQYDLFAIANVFFKTGNNAFLLTSGLNVQFIATGKHIFKNVWLRIFIVNILNKFNLQYVMVTKTWFFKGALSGVHAFARCVCNDRGHIVRMNELHAGVRLSSISRAQPQLEACH